MLLDELVARQQKNSSYSLRAFARDLRISPAVLSQTLSSKRHLAKKNVLKVAENLALSPAEVQHILREIRGRRGTSSSSNEYLQIKEDTFKMMSDWYYFAILSLAKLPGNQADANWVAQRIGIRAPEARSALMRLQRLGFLKHQEGKLARTAAPIATTHDVPSAALRKYHRQNLHRAELSLDRDPVELRDFSSITMVIERQQVQKAKEMVLKFRTKMAKVFESKNPSEIYTLAIQLFPVTGSKTQ